MCQLDILIFFFFSLYEHLHFRWTFAVPLKKHSKMAFTGAQNLGSEHWTLKLLLYRLWSFLPSGLPWDWRDRVWGVHLHHEETLAFCSTLQNIFASLGIKCDILIGLIWKYGKFSWWILHSPQQIAKSGRSGQICTGSSATQITFCLSYQKRQLKCKCENFDGQFWRKLKKKGCYRGGTDNRCLTTNKGT